ncbi:MAG: holo-ACP synthase [Candidatus Omnitrophica bacterium]|nr:holo-ACP synthase [Candidatus Omnitrophota bacterium]MBU3934272.1 holo-ACP synthase [Candidatus Omnitrophota bacterium]MBU4140556.1 holo-ACP synthase [Candidatus Omnitrophota bacterium]
MVIGSGIDIVEVERVQALKDKWKNRFLNKVFTEKELAYANAKRSTAEHLAARIAIKEALIKAFSDYRKKYLGSWKDIEVSNDRSGRPYVNLYGNFKQVKERRKLGQIIISASHTRKYAVASVILTK